MEIAESRSRGLGSEARRGREKEERKTVKRRARSGEANRGCMGGDDGDFLGRIKWDAEGIWLEF